MNSGFFVNLAEHPVRSHAFLVTILKLLHGYPSHVDIAVTYLTNSHVLIHEAISTDRLVIEEGFLPGYKCLSSYLPPFLSLFLLYLSQAAHLTYVSSYIYS